MEMNQWRKDFPILETKVYHKPLVYLDNAATSQMPKQVIDRWIKHYTQEHANVHRGIHYLSECSTNAVEIARKKAADFISAGDKASVIFTQGTTDSIHLVSAGIAQSLKAGQAIISTTLEHHSNFVPWQQMCAHSGAKFLVCPNVDGELDLSVMEHMLRENCVRLVAVGQVSNLTGTVNPLKKIISMAHRYGAEVLVDGAQGILHQGINVTEADMDYYTFSGHKMLAQTGIGVLYGKIECLEKLPPIRFGGGMVDFVTEEETTWEKLPFRLEAGTPNISGIISLGAAIDYLMEHDIHAIRNYERELLAYAEEKLQMYNWLHILGHPKDRSGVISFVADGAHPYDIAALLDKLGVAVRSGQHCALPGLQSFGLTGAVRISPAFYNTKEEIDYLCQSLEKIMSIMLP